MIGTHSAPIQLRRHITGKLDKLASTKKPRLKFVKAAAASLLMLKRPGATERQTKASQVPAPQSPQLRKHDETMRHRLNGDQNQKACRHRMTELNNFIHKERNLIAKDAKLNSKEKSWLLDNLRHLSKENRATHRDTALAQHKSALNAYRNDSRTSPRLKLHLKLIANYIKPTATTPQATDKPTQSNINPLTEGGGYQHIQKNAHINASLPNSSHNKVRHSNQSVGLTPLTKQPSVKLDKNDKSNALNNIDNIIFRGQEASIMQEALKTGFEAASLNSISIGKKQLTDLHKSELSDVMTLAKGRIDTKIALGTLSADAGESAKAKIDNALGEFSTAYDRKTNMTSVMSQLKEDAHAAQNAQDAKKVLLEALNNTRVGKKDSSLRHIMMEARRIAIALPNSKEVRDVLSSFGEQSGLYEQEAADLLKQYAGSLTKTGKGMESLSEQELSYVFRMGKLHTPPGPHADKMNAAIDQLAKDAGLKAR